MGELYFKVELLDDVVLSQKIATVGDHKSLDYIPGSVFLGIAASKNYSKISKDDAWKLFHSSKVRFYNAYPMVSGKRTIPMPLSFHSEKVAREGKDKSVFNFIFHETKEQEIQYKQSRNGYVCFQNNKLKVVMPEKTSRMRTAIDAKTGTAAQTQLYGYESLNAGQIFIGKIEWEDSINGIVSQISKLFNSDSGGIVHIGRSKTASYGRVKISKIDTPKKESKPNELSGSSFSILAVSDLCLRNPDTGTPELSLSPDFLGLNSGWRLDGTRSFSRPSYLYQYNAYRKEIELQKTLISKGSVFTFESDKEMTMGEKNIVLNVIKKGIGDSKGQGFGEIALFNVGKEFYKDDAKNASVSSCEKLTDEEDAWLSWLKPVFISDNVKNKVSDAVNKFIWICKSIKKFHSSDNVFPFWPSKAQWENILEAVRNCNTKEELYSELFVGNNPVIKPIEKSQTELHRDTKIKNPDPEWNREASPKGETLRKWLMDFINDSSLKDGEIRKATQELVKRCKDKIAEKDWLKDGAK